MTGHRPPRPPRLLALAFAALLAAGSAAARTVTYTLDADFDLGAAVNVNHDAVPDQLQINAVPRPYPYVWVAASERGTAVKIDVDTGAILGEYLTAPDGMDRDPSRTTVDRFGNVWVGNRDEREPSGLVGQDGRPYVGFDGSVVKLGLVEAGQCQDRNGNGLIETSTGLGDVRPWTNAGAVDSLGGVTTAADECILLYVRVDPPHVRQVSIDADNDVWVGGDANQGVRERKLQKLDGLTGAALRTIDLNDPADTGRPPLFPGFFGAGYGGFVDCAGRLWSAGIASDTLLRVDPSRPNGDLALILPIDTGTFSYGLGLSPTGVIWHSRWTADDLIQLDLSGAIIGGPFPTSPPTVDPRRGARGVAVTPLDGHAWVANSGADRVTRHRPDGSIAAFVAVGGEPTGVAVDTNGKVWVTNRGSHDVMRIDPATNAVDRTVDLFMSGHPVLDEARPYNYSDMTGIVAMTAMPFGRWTVVTDSACPMFTWETVSWTGAEPGGTRLDVEARSADTAAELTATPFVPTTSGAPLAGMQGRFLETRVNFVVASGASCDGPISPILFDLSVTGDDLTAPDITCPADVTVDCTAPVPDDAPTVSDACSTPTVDRRDRREDGACTGSYRIIRSFTARDASGNAAGCVQEITVRDTAPPSLSGVPADATVECDAVPPPPAVTASDACGPASLTSGETRVPGRCPAEYTLRRTWTASDDCGNATTAAQVLTVVDRTPPTLAGVPADATVECDAVPPPPAVTASDACGPASLTPGETRVPGRCPAEYTLRRTWTASDDCGNATTAAQVLTVVDRTPPTLAGVPADATVECDAVPPMPSVSAIDACGPAALDVQETFTPGRCANEYTITRTWDAADDCGNVTRATQVVAVRDTTPPEVTATHAPDCIWPPNHRYLCFTDLASLVDAVDSCPGALRLEVAGCRSNQPEDQQGPEDRGINGDGDTIDDCIVADDGSGFCLRAERLGQCEDGRTYGVGLAVADACGNETTVELGFHVPHDQHQHPPCVPDDPHDFLLPNEELPFAWTRDPDPDAGLPDPFTCPRPRGRDAR
jgi:YVTN family beta-propeller protein